MCGGVSSRRRRHEARLAGGNSFGGVRRLGRKGGPGQADADRSNPHERRRQALRFLLGQRRQGVERRARARGDPAEDQPGRRGKEMKANERTGLSQLRSQRLRKRYKSRTVVQDVSLDVSSGEVVGLLGPNGAGKTTCFYMIVGLIPVDAGSIHLDTTELTHLPIHRRARLGIAYLPQENSVS